MSGGLGSRRGSAGLRTGVVVALMAGSSGVVAASEDLSGWHILCTRGRGAPCQVPWLDSQPQELVVGNFTGVDLRNVRFDVADLRGTDFTKC
ncbi:hypothetical protein MLPF_3005 [Mycobacterium lepromatosis]|nr:hypothetical protein MLPF_0581 [Mycobacterium lepromatosis]UKN42989.1 hypothetical protein MLPF_3005 [Mycobacterium lepromatosis]